ncbi:micos subunit MIC26 [Diplogelasinospora grovesii]|uniref:MICOS complex subunit n=1 Tax=Diplogelasinospora grovesii TaxID=303347 RepID=A0AAN6S5V0_9PEZI|nr:micos subunit MIC26 [Diplogelasinospora grovesii]
MAARVVFQRRAAPLTAALLVGSIAFYPRVAHAEAADHHAKKPIYDDYEPTPSQPTPTKSTAQAVQSAILSSLPTSVTPSTENEPAIVRQRAPTHTDRLAAQIGTARLFLYRQACAAEDAVNNGMSRAFALEQSFTSTIASLAPPRESGERLMPGLVYVLVAGMAGSIVTRNRNILLRTSMPLALGVGCAWAVIPVTMTNVSNLLWQYEKKFPAVADAHVRTREGIEHAYHMAKVHTQIASEKVTETVRSARETVEGWVKKGK